MNDEQLFEALDMHNRFRLLNHLHPTSALSTDSPRSAPATSAAAVASPRSNPDVVQLSSLNFVEPLVSNPMAEIDRPMSPLHAPVDGADVFSRVNTIDLSTTGSSILSPVPARRVPEVEAEDSDQEQNKQLNAELLRNLELERIEGAASPSAPQPSNEPPYRAAIDSLARLNASRTPEEKLLILRQSFILMNQAITRFWTGRPGAKSLDKYRIVSVDELLPVFMFVVIRAEVPLLQSECNYICDFLDEHMSIGEAGMMVHDDFPECLVRLYFLIRDSLPRLKHLRLPYNILSHTIGSNILTTNPL